MSRRTDTPSILVEAVREACLDAAFLAYEDAGIRGLCAEGRWEAALAAIRQLDLSGVLGPPTGSAPRRGPSRGQEFAFITVMTHAPHSSVRIDVLGDEAIGRQPRTYAEYRVFAALAHMAGEIRRIRVTLRQISRNGCCARVACTVTATLGNARSIRVRSTGAHPYAAINRAVDRLGRSPAVASAPTQPRS